MIILLEKDHLIYLCFMKMTEKNVSFLKGNKYSKITGLGINLLLKKKK